VIRRAALLGLLLLTALLLETTIFGTTTLVGTKPELVLLVVIALAIEEGPAVGAAAGFAGGLATDLLLDAPAGFTSLVFTVVGYGVGAAREQLATPTAWVPLAVTGASTVFGVLAYAGVSALLGAGGISAITVARHAGLAAAYNMLLTPFVVPFVRRLSGRLRLQKVVKL
jgi:rod shape-determining protein MreD